MALDSDYVTEQLDKEPFEILKMEEGEAPTTLVLTVVHDIHPDQEFKVSLLAKDEEGNDDMALQFDGPDDYTDEEAKMVLQQVMDTLVKIIETNLEDNPEIFEQVEGTDDTSPTEEDPND